MKVRVEVKTSGKNVSVQANYDIRPVPEKIYHDLSIVYGKFSGNYKINTYKDIGNVSGILPLLEFLKTDIKAPIPEKSMVSATIGIYGRNSSTHIDPPEDTCALRILFNLGYSDVYRLQSDYRDKDGEHNSGLPNQNIYMKENTYVILGPVNKSKYKLFVDNDKIIKIPAKNPQEKSQTTIRPMDYLRLTVVLDYNIDKNILDNLTEIASSHIPSIKITPNMKKKDIKAYTDKMYSKVTQDQELKKKLEEFKTHEKQEALEETLPEIQQETISDFEQEILNSMSQDERAELNKMMENIGHQ